MNLEQTISLNDPELLGRRLADARKRKGLRQQDAADTLGVARTTVVAVEKGQRRLTQQELINLAELYEAELDTLLRLDLEDEALAVLFRRLLEDTRLFEPESRSALDETVDTLQSYAFQYAALERLLGRPTEPRFGRQYNLKGVKDIEGLAEEAAQEERRRFGLGDGPIHNLQETLEEHVGLRIFRYSMGGKVSGLYGYATPLGACVALNANHPWERQNQTLAHEHGHGVSDPYNINVQVGVLDRASSRAERFATRFGITFLLPEGGVKRQLREHLERRNEEPLTLGDLIYLAHRFCVSFDAYIRRLEELRLLAKGTLDQLKRDKFKVREAQRELGIYAEEQQATLQRFPERYRLLAVEAYMQELLTREQLRKYVELNEVELQALINKYSRFELHFDDGRVQHAEIKLNQQVLRVR